MNNVGDSRNNPGYTNTIIESIIVVCTLKNYDRSYRTNNEKMYYCQKCKQMHHGFSRIGKLHKNN